MAVDGGYGPRGEPQYLDGGAPDLAVDQNTLAKYAANVGNRKAGTKAQREAAAGQSPAAGVWEGLEWQETDTGDTYVRRSGSWLLTYRPWTTFTPTLTGITLGSSPTNTHRYRVSNGQVMVWGQLGLGPGGSFGDVTVSVPLATTQSLPDLLPVGNTTWVDVSDGAVGRYSGAAYLNAGSTVIRLLHVETNGRTVVGPPFSSRDPDALLYNAVYPV